MQRRDRAAAGSTRYAFTVLELLVATTIVGVLMGILLPAIHSAREAARRMQCSNNLHQIGIALHAYHEIHRSLPAGWRLDSTGTTGFGWAASILPQLDEGILYAQIDFRTQIDSPDNSNAHSHTPTVFFCPSDVIEPSFALYAEEGDHGTGGTSSTELLIQLPGANYVGLFGITDPDDVPGDTGEGAFIENRTFRFADFPRGLSNTLFVGERTARKLPSTWFGVVLEGEDAAGRIVGNADLGPNRKDADECEFDSRHPGIVNFLWGDGHVGHISDAIDAAQYRRLATRF